MNTATTKKPKRYESKSRLTRGEGSFTYGTDNKIAQLIGNVFTQWSHLEEGMIVVMASLLGGGAETPARQIFRSLNSAQARLKVMKSLLHEAKSNSGKGSHFDEIITEFASLNKIRNQYVHGLWFTQTATGKLYISEATSDEEMPFLARKRISPKQVQNTLKRIVELNQKVRFTRL